jgi:putative transposase
LLNYLQRAGLWTLTGRMILPIVYGEYQGERFDRMKGQVDLVYRDGQFFLYATIETPEGSPIEVKGFLGVDLGIVNIATDSDGGNHSGADVEKVRQRHLKNRRRYQKKESKGARKALQRQRRREARFRRHQNHCVSKRLVETAKDTGRGIAMEKLDGIRERTTVRAKDRARHSGWAFLQLRSFVEYKAQLAGVPVVLVDPRNTSRTCNVCGHCEAGNRTTRDDFVCKHCGHSAPADLNAARNHRDRAWGTSKRPSELASPRA